MIKRKKTRRPRLDAPVPVASALEPLLEHMGGSRSRSRLAELWANWSQIMGAELGSLGMPLGSHKQILLLGAENGMQMQEISFRAREFLDAANAYLQCEYFREMKVALSRGASRKKKKVAFPRRSEKSSISRPSGKFLAGMDMTSPVARCYALFAGKTID